MFLIVSTVNATRSTGTTMNLAQKLRRRLFPPRVTIEGDENEELVDTIYRKTAAYQAQGSWPLVENVKTVLDFGGGAGVHYKIARQQSPNIRWAVVETPAMVQRAKSLSTDRLMFFERIEQAADWLGSVDLVHSNGAIQYVPAALETVRCLCSTQPAVLAWHRVPIGDASRREWSGGRGAARFQGQARKIPAQLDIRASIHSGSRGVSDH